MVFNSLTYTVFLLVVFHVYWLVMKGKGRDFLLIAASYVFYGWWDGKLLSLLIGMSVMTYAVGYYVQAEQNRKGRRAILCVGITASLGVLGLFKYYDFFVESLCSSLGFESDGLTLKLLLPIGLSFYVFQSISYMADVYRGTMKTIEPISCFLYVSFFPKLVSGPIEKARDFVPQCLIKREFDAQLIYEGFWQILWGLFKKCVVADNCATFVNNVYGGYDTQPGNMLLLSAVLYAFQIYADFSGYSDMAIGSAKLFGFKLKDNFLTPYFSRNMAEFWKRWHISLNTWFIDYVYIPLGGSRGGRWLTIRNTFVIFLLSGLWHGANWTYVGWGLYHAVLFVPLILMGRTKAYKGAAHWRQLPQMLLTFAMATIGWMLFRAETITDFFHFTSGMMQVQTLKAAYHFLIMHELWPLNLNIIIMLLIDWIGRNRSVPLQVLPAHCKYKVLKALLFVLLLMYIILLRGNAVEFVYISF